MSYLTRTGNLTATPELQEAASGRKWCRATMIVNDRERDDEGRYIDTGKAAYNVTVFGSAAENLVAVAQMSGNIRIQFAGRYKVREYTRNDGTSGISHDIVADEIGVSLTGQRVAVDRHVGGDDD